MAVTVLALKLFLGFLLCRNDSIGLKADFHDGWSMACFDLKFNFSHLYQCVKYSYL